MKSKKKKLYFILDVDGVLTDGSFLYNKEGKQFKKFGAHDADGLILVKDIFNIFFISSDKKGFLISKKRVSDMGFKIKYVKNDERYNFIKKYNLKKIIFMGDGIFDIKILKECKYGIAPKNAIKQASKVASFVTKSPGGNGAVFEACIHLYNKFKN